MQSEVEVIVLLWKLQMRETCVLAPVLLFVHNLPSSSALSLYKTSVILLVRLYIINCNLQMVAVVLVFFCLRLLLCFTHSYSFS